MKQNFDNVRKEEEEIGLGSYSTAMIYMLLTYSGCMLRSGQYLNKSSVSPGSLCINTLNLCCLQGKEHLLIVTYTGIIMC